MKKTRILLAMIGVLMLSASIAAAQPMWSVGAKGGVSFATLYGDDSEGSKTATAFAAGGAAMVELNPNFGVGLEVLYSRKGAKEETTDETLALDYIEVPVLAIGIYPVDEKVDLMGYAGPAVAFSIAADFAGEDVKDTIASTDVGGAFGAGARFDAGKVKVTVEGRWTVGFMSIDDSEFDADVKNSVVSAMVGIMFPLGAGAAPAPAP